MVQDMIEDVLKEEDRLTVKEIRRRIDKDVSEAVVIQGLGKLRRLWKRVDREKEGNKFYYSLS